MNGSIAKFTLSDIIPNCWMVSKVTRSINKQLISDQKYEWIMNTRSSHQTDNPGLVFLCQVEGSTESRVGVKREHLHFAHSCTAALHAMKAK